MCYFCEEEHRLHMIRIFQFYNATLFLKYSSMYDIDAFNPNERNSISLDALGRNESVSPDFQSAWRR